MKDSSQNLDAWTPQRIDDTLQILRKNNVLGFELGDFKVTFKGIADPKNDIPDSEKQDGSATHSWEREAGFQDASDMG